MFRVPMGDFFDEDGYTFDPPITPTNNPVSQHEGEVGQELGETGDPVPWSGQTVKLDPFEGVQSFINYLTGPPSEVNTVPPQDAIESVTNLFAALTVTWNPFVPMSYIWNPQYQLLAPLFRAFAPTLCPTCNPEDPFLPPDDVTSIPEPDSARILDLDASALRDIQQSEDLGNDVASPDAKQDDSASADLAKKLDITGGDVQQSVVRAKRWNPSTLSRTVCPPQNSRAHPMSQGCAHPGRRDGGWGRHDHRALDRCGERRHQGRSRAVRWTAYEARWRSGRYREVRTGQGQHQCLEDHRSLEG